MEPEPLPEPLLTPVGGRMLRQRCYTLAQEHCQKFVLVGDIFQQMTTILKVSKMIESYLSKGLLPEDLDIKDIAT